MEAENISRIIKNTISANELKDERDMMEDMINKLNTKLGFIVSIRVTKNRRSLQKKFDT